MKQYIQDQVDMTTGQLLRSEKLINLLGDETDRWTI